MDGLSACRFSRIARKAAIIGKRDYGLYQSGPATKLRLVRPPAAAGLAGRKKSCGNQAGRGVMEGWKVRGLLGLALAICISYSVLPAQAQERVGVTAAVNLDAEGQAPSKPVEKLVLGHNVVHNERISTLDKGQV